MTEAGMNNPDKEIQLGKNAADAAKQVRTHEPWAPLLKFYKHHVTL